MAGHIKTYTDIDKRPHAVAVMLGVGYTARAMIAHLKDCGFYIFGTVRNASQAQEVRALGVEPVLFLSPECMSALARAELLISSIPPDKHGDPFIGHIGHDFKAVAPNVGWAGYMSATSVYGDRAGDWAVEDDLLRPRTERGRRRVQAELDWLESGAPVHIFRLAGIYGPEIGGVTRNSLARIKAGTARAIIKPKHKVNRIYVTDIARAVAASLDRPDPTQIYNLADDEPAPPQDALDFAADLIHAPRPPRIEYDKAELSHMARSFYLETKRICNARAKVKLGWTPQYGSYRDGLRAIVKADIFP